MFYQIRRMIPVIFRTHRRKYMESRNSFWELRKTASVSAHISTKSIMNSSLLAVEEPKLQGNMESKRNADTLKDKLSKLPEKKKQPIIYKVHRHLRNINRMAYEPQIIAIGPYHHGNENLKMMEERKLRYLDSVLKRNKTVELGKYISAIEELEEEARNCYAETARLNKVNFTEMLVLDGCFIIELILRNCENLKYLPPTDIDLDFDLTRTDNDPIFWTGWIMYSLKRDLILFENQIPFFVLCKLFDLIGGPNQHNVLMDLVLFFCRNLYPGAADRRRINMSSVEVKHILHLLHNNWRPLSHDHDHDHDDDDDRDFMTNYTAKALKDANVKFNVMKASESLFDVDFNKGLMLIPRLAIDDKTECLFRNLIAYEQYIPRNQPIFVTHYVVLMDRLISSATDVEILSESGIIQNGLGDNEAVANMFNRLLDSVTDSAGRFVYAETLKRILEHKNKSWNKAMAVYHRDYFNSPWAYIKFFAALLLLLLTLAQTVFSALNYF